ncbi:MAG: CcmD family protein [Chloroflexi bacterium]|nr:CcmD family protein [Chloroflexota bacterium]
MSQSLIYLFAAFAVVWVGLFAYLLYLSNRMGALQGQVEFLLEEHAAVGPAEDAEQAAARVIAKQG